MKKLSYPQIFRPLPRLPTLCRPLHVLRSDGARLNLAEESFDVPIHSSHCPSSLFVDGGYAYVGQPYSFTRPLPVIIFPRRIMATSTRGERNRRNHGCCVLRALLVPSSTGCALSPHPSLCEGAGPFVVTARSAERQPWPLLRAVLARGQGELPYGWYAPPPPELVR